MFDVKDLEHLANVGAHPPGKAWLMTALEAVIESHKEALHKLRQQDTADETTDGALWWLAARLALHGVTPPDELIEQAIEGHDQGVRARTQAQKERGAIQAAIRAATDPPEQRHEYDEDYQREVDGYGPI